MKFKTLVSSLAAIFCLATHSSATISSYLDQTIVPTNKSLHMNWNPTDAWTAVIGSHTGGEPLYLSSATNYDFGDGDLSYSQGYIGSWGGTALSLSTGYINLASTVNSSLSFSNYIDLTPVDNSNSTFSGLRYDLGGGNYHYGWINYSTNADSTQITLLGAAFNTVVNEPILAGQTSVIPEPSAAWISGLLGSVILLRRRVSRQTAP